MRPARSSDPVFAEQVRSSFAHLPLTLTVSVLNSILVGFVLTSVAAGSTILAWIGLVAGLSSLRLLLWYAHGRLDIGSTYSPWWTRIAVVGALGSGILWGSGPVVFFSLDESHLLFFSLVIGGMCAGAATVHAAHFPSAAAFIVPAIVPLAADFFLEGTRLGAVSGVMACVFGMSLCVASLKFRAWFRDTTSARLALAGQTSALNEANTRLTAEIASRRSTEAQLERAQKLEAIGRLTAGIAHDFNNLLMAIGGSAELIERRLPPESVCTPHVQAITRSVERGAALTQQLLAFGRKQALAPSPVSINEMLLALKELLVITLGDDCRLELELDHSLSMTLVDKAQLELAVFNLVINARDAMPSGGALTIKTANVNLDGLEIATDELVGSFVMVSVSDTGTGMSDSVRLHAFDPFFTTKEIGKGSGLGLSQVYGLVQQSGGTTQIELATGPGNNSQHLLAAGSE